MNPPQLPQKCDKSLGLREGAYVFFKFARPGTDSSFLFFGADK